MNNAIENNNKEKNITQSQCHSSSNKKLYKTNLETILENTTIINTCLSRIRETNRSSQISDLVELVKDIFELKMIWCPDQF
jgi:hypothetical protein